ncbi:MAPEG family protein [Chachezhania sediminis]|uniref:MAPEG family protein n=1 Tax=Chachezhania sediminis TaxID=2599291 RepID=UPI00131C9E04|nr:MAPEG family protein [Chachezhania sediminis]
MDKQKTIAAGMGLGAICALVQLALPELVRLPAPPPGLALPLALLSPAAVLIAIVGRIAGRRFFDPELIDGQPPAPGSAAAIDGRVLQNTVEQALIAALVWPFVAHVQGGAAVLVLAVGFAVLRLIFWVGYHKAPPLRSLGFAGTFYSTVLALVWAVISALI